MIWACLADEVPYGILEERSSRSLWLRLRMYMGKNLCNKLMLKNQLYSLRMQEGGDVAGHIQLFDQMSMDFLNIRWSLKSRIKVCSCYVRYLGASIRWL